MILKPKRLTESKIQILKKRYVHGLVIATMGILGGQSLAHSQVALNKDATHQLASNPVKSGIALPFTLLKADWGAPTTNQTIKIHNGGFGSDAAAHPSKPNQFYALTDRGPNTDFIGAQGEGKQFLIPDYSPKIGLFELTNSGQIRLIKQIVLKTAQNKPINGLPNPSEFGATHEIAYDLQGAPLTVHPNLPFDPKTNPTKTDLNGLDAEGLAALNDGTFWVSDEYGPHIVHYNQAGREIGRINAFANDPRNNVVVNGKKILLPAEFANRRANRGMEGLTITPDQSTLVGIMQSAMDNPDKSGRKSVLTRIVSLNLKSGELRQYLYPQNQAGYSNSGIVAINDHEFYVIERDGKFPLQDTNSQKHIYKIDLKGATNIQNLTPSKRMTYDPKLGLMIDNKTLEQWSAGRSDVLEKLLELKIRPVKKQLVLDAVAALNYPHDKLEGLWLRRDGKLGLINDDDFSVETQNNVILQKYLDTDNKILDVNRLYVIDPKAQ